MAQCTLSILPIGNQRLANVNSYLTNIGHQAGADAFGIRLISNDALAVLLENIMN